MASTTLGVKVDDLLRSRLKDAATRLERTPHWLIKQAIFAYLEQIEHGQLPPELSGATGAADLAERRPVEQRRRRRAASVPRFRAERATAIGAARGDHGGVSSSGAGMRAVPDRAGALAGRASPATRRRSPTKLVEALRAKSKGGGVEALMHEFSLSSARKASR